MRRQVKGALDRIECACALSEDWTGGYAATVQKCQRKVLQSQGFMLLLGHWYGSIPPGQQKSITHLEFEWAQQRPERKRYEQMAVLRPKPGTAIDKKLRQAAQDIIVSSATDPDRHADLLKAFHDQVDDRSTEWRIITPFKTVQDLREHALVIANEWRGSTPLAAAQGRVATTSTFFAQNSQVTEEMLGELGRKAQIDAVEAVISGIPAYPDMPAVALLIHGDEDAGHRPFLSYLIANCLDGYYPKQPIGGLPIENASPAAFVAWVARKLGVTDVSRPEIPEQLAEAVADELRSQPLHFVLDRIGTLEGGVSAFREKFWTPFWHRLRELRAERGIGNRLVAVLSDYSGDESRWAQHAVASDDIASSEDYLKLVAVPKLGAIEKKHVLAWFAALEVPDTPPGRRVKLADFLLKNDRQKADTVPAHVYGRARSQQLWPEEP